MILHPKRSQPLYLLVVTALTMTFTSQAALATVYTWNGSTDATWATKQNWTPSSGPPASGDTAQFNATSASVNGRTTLTIATVAAATILFDTANAAAYTLGASAGSGTITLDNAGAVTMNAAVANNQLINSNVVLGTATAASYTFTNNSTTNSLTFAGTISGGIGGIAGAKTLNVGGAGATTLSGAVSNGGASSLGISKSGSGTLTLSKSTGNTYSGNTSLAAGTLLITNTSGSATGSGNVNFTNAAATPATIVSGAGTTGVISGLVTTANTNSILTPGGSGTVGTMTLGGGLTASAGARFNFDIATKTGSDLISLSSGVFTGPTATNSGQLNISFNALTGAQAGQTYKLFTYGSQLNVDPGDFAVVNSPGFGGATFTVTGTEVDVIFSTVPEPGTWVAGCLSVLAVAFTQRRRLRGLVSAIA